MKTGGYLPFSSVTGPNCPFSLMGEGGVAGADPASFAGDAAAAGGGGASSAGLEHPVSIAPYARTMPHKQAKILLRFTLQTFHIAMREVNFKLLCKYNSVYVENASRLLYVYNKLDLAYAC